MFWNKKKKLPITDEDRDWIDEDLNWLRTELGEIDFMEIKTVTPSKDFYNRVFDASEKDAEFILLKTMELMNIRAVEIKLEYFSDEPVMMSDGNILSSPADLNGRWNSAAGTFQQKENQTIIAIERGQLKNPNSLVATISHELSHQILLGENRIEENDEYLTDLTAITYGFGIFIGNARFQFDSFISNDGFGWESTAQGYLPEQIIGYAMAWMAIQRNENIDYIQHLNKSLQKYFNQSFEYLTAEKEAISRI